MSGFQNEYADYCEKHGTPERIELLMCDLNGVMRGKWLPGDGADKLVKNAVRLPISSYTLDIDGEEVEETGYGVTVGDPDGYVTPFPGTLKPVPWANIKTAQLQVQIKKTDGTEMPIDSRVVLQNMLKRFKKRGLTPVAATELEFYLIRQRAEKSDAPQPADISPGAHAYDMEIVDQQEVFLQEILNTCAAQGLPADTVIAELGYAVDARAY